MRKLVWGIPIRLFHWILLGLVSFSFYTGKFGDFDSIDNHMLAGYGIICLILFRIGYGLFGKGHIRFSEFLPKPSAIIAYLKNPQETQGHNPLGSLGVFALLLSLTIQTTSGLFTSDEIFVEGPLYHLVDSSTSSLLAQIHGINQWVLLGLIALHLIAVVVHELILKHRIVWPMIVGTKNLGASETTDEKSDASSSNTKAQHQYGLAITCLAIAAATTWFIVNKL